MANYPELVEKHETFDVYKVNVPTFMICAFLYDDETAFTSTGKDEYETFKAFLSEEFASDNWAMVSCEDESFVSQFNGLLTELTEAIFYIHKN